MYLKCLLSLAMFVATVTTYALEDPSIEKEVLESKEKRIVKRDAAILIDNFPVEPIFRSDPFIVYRHITRRRYNPNTKYGPPKSKYRSIKTRKPNKKHKKPSSTKYGPPSRKKRPTKPRYGPPKISYKPVYGPPKKKPTYSHYEPEVSWDFGDATSNFEQTYEKPSFGEPPSDFSIPFNDASNIYVEKYKPDEFDNAKFEHSGHFGTFKNNHNYDSEPDFDFAHTKERPVFVKSEPDFHEFSNDDSHIDHDFLKHINNQNPLSKYEKRKPYLKKQAKRPSLRPITPSNEEDDEVLVGGQYAEPPARYVPKFQPSASTYDDTEFSPMHYYMNPDRVSTMSSYVNYKNSNMAFSPQNLNDAFSIVET